ncbi:ABC transporter ATP-binding protein [Lagierella massiliensis]|uniref:ABC transporter ATP-binding protein n=1 Tax=Lagierella massiliensis TaxID=1689303 RepID=UPI0006D78C17|nr:ABC transporter ATP-binding protein [Lagierella massiliensis]
MLEVRDLYKSFGENDILKGVNLQMEKGKIHILLGNNGSGKSTIINCMLKLLKYDRGSITLDGEEIEELSNFIYFKKVSALLESSVNVYDNLSGEENIRYFAGLNRINIKKFDKHLDYIKEFKLENHLDKKVGDYSRGMKQKLSLIIALISDPDYLLLDEPTLGLDFESTNNIIKILKKLAIEQNKSILITSHQIDVIEKLEGELLFLNDGKVEHFNIMDYSNSISDSYNVKFIQDGKTITKREDSQIESFIKNYEEKNIIEIKKNEISLDEIVKVKLDENNKM